MWKNLQNMDLTTPWYMDSHSMLVAGYTLLVSTLLASLPSC